MSDFPAVESPVAKASAAVSARSTLALIALMLLTICIGVGEFVVMGLLSQVAGAFGVSVASAGWVVTGYALGVAIGGPLIALSVTRVERRRLLLILGMTFLLGTALCGWAPTYSVLLLGRVVASAAHGAFVGAAVVAATRLVRPERAGTAVAVVIGGFTVATVIGVPLGTWAGQALGWRAVFWLIAGFSLLGWLLLAVLLQPDHQQEAPDLRRELRTLARPTVAAALTTTALGFGGMFAVFTYVEPLLTGVTGFAPSSVPALLLLFGLGALVGTVLGGRLADRAVQSTLLWFLGVLSLALVVLPVVAEHSIGTGCLLFLVGAASFGSAPGLQLQVVQRCVNAPFLSSTLNVSAFNAGNAIGAFSGGLLVAGSGSPRYTAWIGVGMTGAAWLIVAGSTRRTSAHPPTP